EMVESGDPQAARREAALASIFSALDQKCRGFVSKVELSHILDAMQADTSVKLPIPESLQAANIPRDSKVSLADLSLWLAELSVADLEDVKWFAESVVKVESELRSVWHSAVEVWREQVATLHARDLHRYLLATQPERVSRWLLLRTSMEEPGKEEPSHQGLPGLGITQPEVEVLFTDEMADAIRACSSEIEPFLMAVELRDQLGRTCFEGEVAQICPPDSDAQASELLAKLTELAAQGRELACLLIHEDTLGFATALVRSRAFSQTAVCAASQLIMVILSYRIHENARDYERLCRQMVARFLEVGFDPSAASLDLQAEAQRLRSGPSLPGRLGLQPRASHESETMADWVGHLVTQPVDFDRGEMLDILIRYDEKRLMLCSDGGERQDETSPVPVSLFSYGRTVVHLLGRLDIASHHSLHEHRTPMRTHVWKFLLNVISRFAPRFSFSVSWGGMLMLGFVVVVVVV
ncbi:unnamed protein product, partial [Polarella glacialis]